MINLPNLVLNVTLFKKKKIFEKRFFDRMMKENMC